MSKEEFLKIQTCVLKVNIHCEGCKNKVKKILQRIEGVYTINIDSEWGKVTVSGNVDSATLIKKLVKKGKHAELWGNQKANNNNQNHQLKNLQIDSGKGGNGNKGKGEKGTNNLNQMQMKGGNPGMVLPQQLQQMKGVQDMKILPPQFKDLKIPAVNLGGGNPKTVKFDLPEEDGFTDDDEFDDYDEYDDDDEDDDYDDDFDDEMDIMPPNKMKPVMGNGGGGAQMPNIMHLMNGNGKKGGIMPQMNMGGGKGGGNQIQGGGSPKKSGKNGGGHPQDGKNFGSNGGQNKNSGGGGGHGGAAGGGGGPNFNGNGGNKGGGIMNNGLPSMPNMMAMKASVPNMGPMPTGQMGHHMGQMGNLPMGQIPAVQGLPAPGMSSARSNGGYFQASGPEILAGNPYQQQQMAAMMMNQQQANGNERFQPMMYAPQPPAVNYLPPPYPYYPYPQPSDNYGSLFSDENPSACKVM